MSDQNYQEFIVEVPNGTTCKVRYLKGWSMYPKIDNTRVDHYELLDNETISETLYRSEFLSGIPIDRVDDPIEKAKWLISKLTGLKYEENFICQQRMF